VSSTANRQNKITGDIADGLGGGVLAVEKTGAGLWVLEGAKTFSGGLTIREGELRLAGNAAAAGTGAINPLFPASSLRRGYGRQDGPATGSFNGLHAKSKFLAAIKLLLHGYG
jgi:autotransporter-associated beta strand protein